MSVSGTLRWVTFCTCAALFCTALPTRRQFSDITETTSSEPVGLKEGDVWNNEDFDLDAGDDDWLVDTSPSSAPQRVEYQDNEEEDYPDRKKDESDLDDDVEHQDAEAEDDDDDSRHEFLFIPSKDTRLLLQDDDDKQAGPFKVRHTGKNSYSESFDPSNSIEDSKDDKNNDDDQFEFTIDKDDGGQSMDEDDMDDFVLEGEGLKDPSEAKDLDPTPREEPDDNSVSAVPRRQLQEDDEDDSDDDDNVIIDDDNPMLDSPEEDSQVIYGDHVFLY